MSSHIPKDTLAGRLIATENVPSVGCWQKNQGGVNGHVRENGLLGNVV